MDRLQNPACSKSFSRNEQGSNSSYDVDGKGSSLPDMNELDRGATKLNEISDNLDFYANVNARYISLESQQNVFAELEQNTSNHTEYNSNFSATNTSNENTEYNFEPAYQFTHLQQGSPLCLWPSTPHVDLPPYVSGDREAISNYFTELSISSNSSNFNIVKSNIHDYTETFQPSLHQKNTMQGSTSNTSNLREEFGENINVSKTDTRSFNDAFLPESFDNSERRFYTYDDDIPKKTDITEKCGFSQGQTCEGSQDILQYSEGPQTQMLSGRATESYDNRCSQLQRSGERIPLMNETKAFASPSSINVEDQMLQQGGCFICLKCGKGFRRKLHFVYHYRIHSGEKPFVCDICGKRFIQKSTLNMHIRTHTKEKPFVCDMCGKNFADKSNMKRHFRTHTKEKPFTCAECGKGFAHKFSMKQHLLNHTVKKPFVCCRCGKSFAWKSNMKEHFRIHTGVKPFVCGECGKRFSQKNHLNTHLLTHTK